MENKHKLDTLLEDLTNISKNTFIDIKVNAQYNLKYTDGWRSAIQLTISNVTVWYQTCAYNRIPTLKDIEDTKDRWYNELLMYIVLTRLPIWKASTEILTFNRY